MSEKNWDPIGSELGKVLSNTNYQIKIRKMKKTTLLTLAGIGALIIWFIGARWVFRGITNADEKEAKEAMVSDCGCSSIDECLNQNKLDCAWKMYEADDIKIYPYPDLIKLIKAQCALHIQKEEYQQGWDYIKKQDFDSSDEMLKAYEYEFLNSVIDRVLMSGNAKVAKLWAMKASDEHNTEGWRASQTNDFDPKKTQRKLLLAKVNEFE